MGPARRSAQGSDMMSITEFQREEGETHGEGSQGKRHRGKGRAYST